MFMSVHAENRRRSALRDYFLVSVNISGMGTSIARGDDFLCVDLIAKV